MSLCSSVALAAAADQVPGHLGLVKRRGDVKGAPLKVVEGGGKGGGGWCLGQCRLGVWQEDLLRGGCHQRSMPKVWLGRCKRLLANALMAAVDRRAAHRGIHAW